jgi:hypothetical protein
MIEFAESKLEFNFDARDAYNELKRLMGDNTTGFYLFEHGDMDSLRIVYVSPEQYAQIPPEETYIINEHDGWRRYTDDFAVCRELLSYFPNLDPAPIDYENS